MRIGQGLLMLMALAMATSGCSKELMAGGQSEVVTSMRDSGGSSGSRNAVVGSRHLLRSVLPAASGVQGVVRAVVKVALVGAAGEVDPVTGSSTTTVQIGSSDRVGVGRDSVEAGAYTAARVTFSAVTADITGGLVAAGGLPVLGEITVQLAEPMTLDVPIELTVQPGSRHDVVIDLNAPTWLAMVDPLTRSVSAAAFRAAIQVHAE